MDLKDQSVAELKAKFIELSKDIFEMKNEISTTQKLDKPHLMRVAKRDRARILTFLRQKDEKVTYEG